MEWFYLPILVYSDDPRNLLKFINYFSNTVINKNSEDFVN